MISRGKADARKLTHARVLLQADASEGGLGWADAAISDALRVSVRTIERVRQVLGENALKPHPRQTWCIPPKPSAEFGQLRKPKPKLLC